MDRIRVYQDEMDRLLDTLEGGRIPVEDDGKVDRVAELLREYLNHFAAWVLHLTRSGADTAGLWSAGDLAGCISPSIAPEEDAALSTVLARVEALNLGSLERKLLANAARWRLLTAVREDAGTLGRLTDPYRPLEEPYEPLTELLRYDVSLTKAHGFIDVHCYGADGTFFATFAFSAHSAEGWLESQRRR